MKPLRTLLLCLPACVVAITLTAEKDSILTLPFTKLDNLIILEAEVHGIKGAFILDTGIEDVFLNQRYFEESSEVVHTDQVVGINGRARQVGLLRTDIEMAGIRQGIEALVVDLTHIEKSKNIQLLGLIGQQMFKHHELLFDLPNYSIRLIPVDKKGRRTVAFNKPASMEIPFKTKGHLPVLVAEMKDLELFLGFDTGAECNVIDPKFLDQIELSPKWNKQANLASGWKSQKTVAYKVPGMKVMGQKCPPMLTVFAALSSINDELYGPQLDGIIGMEWLLQQKVAFNFRQKRCFIWEKEEQVKKEVGVKAKRSIN